MTARFELVPTSRQPELQPEALDEQESPGRFRSWLMGALTVAGLAAALSFWVWVDGAERRAIRELPEAQRQELLSRTLQNLDSVCNPAADSMRDFCREQARLAREFPGCDEACQRMADRQLSRVQPPR